jgi:Mrp family chromosome partitioning ATPase/predicted Fe-Mo cluster-binding NifX family protein
MGNIQHKYLVLSGKGGVGKSSIAVNLAVWLAEKNRNVGLLDIDIHGPSVPKLLNLGNPVVKADGDGIIPVSYGDRLKVMSIGFLLQNDKDALIWRGPMKHNVIKQFVDDVCWGELDYLVVDCPPGTGDEPLSIVQTSGKIDGAIIVTTPQQLAIVDVKKCITFCRQLNLPVLGVVENMSGFVCPNCGKRADVFGCDGGKQMAEDFGVTFLGSIPMDGDLASACDSGKPFIDAHNESPTAQAIAAAFEPLLVPDERKFEKIVEKKGTGNMKIAIPLTDGKLSAHFGHCEQFAIVEVDSDKNIISENLLTPPAHEPGVLPKWLAEMNVELIIAGGMGQRAQQLFAQNNIDVAVGAPADEPQQIVSDYLAGRLQCGQNICDH